MSEETIEGTIKDKEIEYLHGMISCGLAGHNFELWGYHKFYDGSTEPVWQFRCRNCQVTYVKTKKLLNRKERKLIKAAFRNPATVWCYG